MARRSSGVFVFFVVAALGACACSRDRDRDREPVGTGTLTGASGDQSGVAADSENDRRIGQTIRQSIDDDGDLSPLAKTVTVISAGGVVTLRGRVKTEDEKAAVGAKARTARGVSRVDNLLEVETP